MTFVSVSGPMPSSLRLPRCFASSLGIFTAISVTPEKREHGALIHAATPRSKGLAWDLPTHHNAPCSQNSPWLSPVVVLALRERVDRRAGLTWSGSNATACTRQILTDQSHDGRRQLCCILRRRVEERDRRRSGAEALNVRALIGLVEERGVTRDQSGQFVLRLLERRDHVALIERVVVALPVLRIEVAHRRCERLLLRVVGGKTCPTAETAPGVVCVTELHREIALGALQRSVNRRGLPRTQRDRAAHTSGSSSSV